MDYREQFDSLMNCKAIQKTMESRGWKYVPGNFLFIKADKEARVLNEMIIFSFTTCDGRYKYTKSFHKRKL